MGATCKGASHALPGSDVPTECLDPVVQRRVCTMQCFRFERGRTLDEVGLLGETLENALRRLKVLQERIIQDVKRHVFYLKPPKAVVEAGSGAQAELEENT